jgi:hypothetical protein
VEPAGAGTQVTSLYRGESRGFFKLAEPLVVRLTRKHFETAAENLRTLLEDQALLRHHLSARVNVDLGARAGADLPGQRLGGLFQADGHLHDA